MTWEFQHAAGPFTLAEGPVWDGETLLFTDIRANRIMRYDPQTGQLRRLSHGHPQRERPADGCRWSGGCLRGRRPTHDALTNETGASPSWPTASTERS